MDLPHFLRPLQQDWRSRGDRLCLSESRETSFKDCTIRRINQTTVGALIAGAFLADVSGRLLILIRPGLSYWTIAGVVIAFEVLAYLSFMRHVDLEVANIAKEDAERRARISGLSQPELIQEATTALANEMIFDCTPASPTGSLLPDWVPASVQAVLANSDTIRRVDDDFQLDRKSLALLANGELQLGAWESEKEATVHCGWT